MVLLTSVSLLHFLHLLLGHNLLLDLFIVNISHLLLLPVYIFSRSIHSHFGFQFSLALFLNAIQSLIPCRTSHSLLEVLIKTVLVLVYLAKIRPLVGITMPNVTRTCVN